MFMVLDTNVLLSRLALIQQLHATAAQGQFQVRPCWALVLYPTSLSRLVLPCRAPSRPVTPCPLVSSCYPLPRPFTLYPYQVVLFLPYVVITELDYLKESTRSCTMPDGTRVTLESRARAAVR